mgnify:CR=1 FL=1
MFFPVVKLPKKMKLKELIESTGYAWHNKFCDFEVKGVTSDSRKISDGFIFVAIKGTAFDGHNFIQEAVQKGARAIIGSVDSSQLTAHRNIPYIRVDDSRKSLADLSAAFWGHPSSSLKLVGITGTNGKTTVSYLIESILRCAGCNPAVIGTINYRFKGQIFNAGNTTPGSAELQALLARMQKEKVDFVIIEVSSHALDQERVRAIKFSTGIFTNLSPEHLDYHRDLNSYFIAKSKLFKNLPREGFAILNIDDACAPELEKLTEAYVITYGLSNSAEVYVRDSRFSLEGMEFTLCLRERTRKSFSGGINSIDIKSSLIGKHNLYNILAAATFGLTQKIKPKILKAGIEKVSGVPGRLERVSTGRDFYVFVDYAHTEDALKNAIASLRPLCKGRLCVVFGCGGNRDKSKRPKMGKVASELADLAIVTSDNPRSEEPEKIIEDIVSGISKQNFKVFPDRGEAIKQALSRAKKDDIILIAGKGHENYQIFRDKIIHFDDREFVREYLNR